MKSIVCAVLLVVSGSLPCVAQFLGNTKEGSQVSDSDVAVLQSLLHSSRPPLVFRPDDTLTVELYGVKDYSVQQQVGVDGSVRFPLVGKVQVSGLTIEDLETTLERSLSASGMIQQPHVTVKAVSRPSAIVTVSGDVLKPGVYPAYGDLTLIDYLSQAGGLNESASTGSVTPANPMVTLIRPSLKAPVGIPLGPDPMNSPYARIPVYSGDEIRVGQMGVVYAVGAFKTEGAYPLKNSSPTTVFQLMALAGGIGYQGDKKDAYIVRTRESMKYVIKVNVSKIIQGKIADVNLQPNDILFVPTNQMRAAIKAGAPGVIVGLATAFIYTHP